MPWFAPAFALTAVLLGSWLADGRVRTNGQGEPSATIPPAFTCVSSPPSSPTQPPLVCHGGGEIAYPAGWNLVAGYQGRDGSDTYVFGAVGPLYTLQTGDDAYEAAPLQLAAGVSWTTLQTGLGYWAFFSMPTSIYFPVPPVPQQQTRELPAGQWVMVGNPYAVKASLAGADLIYAYSAGGGYVPATTLRPGEGAWVYSSAGGVLTFRISHA